MWPLVADLIALQEQRHQHFEGQSAANGLVNALHQEA